MPPKKKTRNVVFCSTLQIDWSILKIDEYGQRMSPHFCATSTLNRAEGGYLIFPLGLPSVCIESWFHGSMQSKCINDSRNRVRISHPVFSFHRKIHQSSHVFVENMNKLLYICKALNFVILTIFAFQYTRSNCVDSMRKKMSNKKLFSEKSAFSLEKFLNDWIQIHLYFLKFLLVSIKYHWVWILSSKIHIQFTRFTNLQPYMNNILFIFWVEKNPGSSCGVRHFDSLPRQLKLISWPAFYVCFFLRWLITLCHFWGWFSPVIQPERKFIVNVKRLCEKFSS